MLCRIFILKSFCGCALKSGSVCVLCFELVFQIIRLILLFGKHYDSLFEVIWVFLLIGLASVAFYGVKEAKPCAMIPYIAMHGIDLLLCGYFVYWAIKNTNSNESWPTINLGLFYIASCTISFFSIAVIYSYYVEILEGDSLRMFLLREV